MGFIDGIATRRGQIPVKSLACISVMESPKITRFSCGVSRVSLLCY